MFKIFPDNKVIESLIDINRRYPDYGYLVKNPIEQYAPDGTILPCKGILHAICDIDGLHEFWKESMKLHDAGVAKLVDTTNLFSDIIPYLEVESRIEE